MSVPDLDAFLALGEALKAAGWGIMKFENLGGGVELTIVPFSEKEEAE
jgi:hypothetical protein